MFLGKNLKIEIGTFLLEHILMIIIATQMVDMLRLKNTIVQVIELYSVKNSHEKTITKQEDCVSSCLREKKYETKTNRSLQCLWLSSRVR